ncbi:MAG: PDZ domain-containing protein [Planctomycetes bacterium]|nr:PDZ domain-containing protein [Planctomycetota bacterium]
MTKLLVIPGLVLAIAAAAAVGFAQDETVKPQPPNSRAAVGPQEDDQKADPPGDRLEALQDQLRELEREQRKIQREIDRLRRGQAGDRAAPRATPPQSGAPRPLPFLDRFRGLEDQLRELEEHFRQFEHQFGGALPLLPRGGILGSSSSISVRQTEDGVRVEVKTQDADGKESVEVYEAQSPEAFAKQYPEVVRKYGLRFGDDGTFQLDFGPRFDFRLGDRRFPRGMPRLDPDSPRLLPAPRERLGVLVEPLNPERAGELGLDTRQGLVVREVQPDTLAERLGLASEDVLLTINGKAIGDTAEVAAVLRGVAAEGTVTVEAFRPGQGKLKLEARKQAALRKIL